MNQLGPIQFDFNKLWFHSRRKMMAKTPIQQALAEIQNRWMEIAEFKYEENSPHDEDLAREELALDEHIGKVKIKDLNWLRQKFENIDLTELSLAIAQDLMPDKTWELIENDEEAVVTDTERSVVFDMKHGHEISAGASLLIVGDKKYQPAQAAVEEFETWLRKRTDFSEMVLDTMRDHLARFDKPGVLLNFTNPLAPKN